MPKRSAKKEPTSDEVTRKKIDKHLSDKDDTISEQDIKNMNTDPKTLGKRSKETKEEEPKKEMPSTWDIVDES